MNSSMSPEDIIVLRDSFRTLNEAFEGLDKLRPVIETLTKGSGINERLGTRIFVMKCTLGRMGKVLNPNEDK